MNPYRINGQGMIEGYVEGMIEYYADAYVDFKGFTGRGMRKETKKMEKLLRAFLNAALLWHLMLRKEEEM